MQRSSPATLFMQTALGQVVLKRILLLLLLLDKAVELPALPKGVPLLFCVQRNIKSSREVWCLQHSPCLPMVVACAMGAP